MARFALITTFAQKRIVIADVQVLYTLESIQHGGQKQFLLGQSAGISLCVWMTQRRGSSNIVYVIKRICLAILIWSSAQMKVGIAVVMTDWFGTVSILAGRTTARWEVPIVTVLSSVMFSLDLKNDVYVLGIDGSTYSFGIFEQVDHVDV